VIVSEVLLHFELWLCNTKTVAAEMNILVKTLSCRSVEVEVTPTLTVKQLKEIIAEREGIPPDLQKLIFFGTSRDDKVKGEEVGKTKLSDYRIDEGTVIYVVQKMKP